MHARRISEAGLGKECTNDGWDPARCQIMLRLPSLESASYMKVAPLCPFRNTLVFSAESPYRNAATPRPSFLGKIWGGQGPKNVLVPGSYSLPTAKQMSLVNKFSEDLDGHLQAPRSQRLRARASNATIAPRHGHLVIRKSLLDESPRRPLQSIWIRPATA